MQARGPSPPSAHDREHHVHRRHQTARSMHHTIIARLFIFGTAALAGCASTTSAGTDSDGSDAGPSGSNASSQGGGADAGADASRGPLRVFVTAEGFTGALATLAGEADSLKGADVLCTRAASNAGLAGSFVAYLGGKDTADAGVAAVDRIAGAGPWVAVGTGEVVFPDRVALDAETLPTYQLLRTERGELPVASPSSPNITPTLWTGTRKASAMSGDTCGNWTRASGARGALIPGTCGCIGQKCTADDWREHKYGLYPGVCFCEYEDPATNPRLLCFERR